MIDLAPLRRDCRRIRALRGDCGIEGWKQYALACGLSVEEACDIWAELKAEEMGLPDEA